MEVGDKIMFVPFCATYRKGSKELVEPVEGRICWIHPQRRFVVVERQTKYYTYRETLPLKGRTTHHENDSNYEPEGRCGENRHGPQFGRRTGQRR